MNLRRAGEGLVALLFSANLAACGGLAKHDATLIEGEVIKKRIIQEKDKPDRYETFVLYNGIGERRVEIYSEEGVHNKYEEGDKIHIILVR